MNKIAEDESRKVQSLLARVKNFLKNKYIGEVIGLAILILCVMALTIGPAFLQEHALLIIILLLVVIVISGAI